MVCLNARRADEVACWHFPIAHHAAVFLHLQSAFKVHYKADSPQVKEQQDQVLQRCTTQLTPQLLITCIIKMIHSTLQGHTEQGPCISSFEAHEQQARVKACL